MPRSYTLTMEHVVNILKIMDNSFMQEHENLFL